MSQPSADVAARIRQVVGATPISFRPIADGYTVADRWIVALSDGRSAFVKSATDADTAEWIRDEHRIYAGLNADFLPTFLGWNDAELPLLILEDLSGGAWRPEWTQRHVAGVLAMLDRVHSRDAPPGLPVLDSSWFRQELTGWQQIERDPAGFLRLGLASPDWLREALPTLVRAEQAVELDGDALVHLDVRSDNICFHGDRTLLVDWNWAHRGNPEVDLIFWLPSLHMEKGPAPWDLTLDEPELIAAVAGYFAFRAPQPPHKQGPAVRRLQLAQLKVALPWACRALRLPMPTA